MYTINILISALIVYQNGIVWAHTPDGHYMCWPFGNFGYRFLIRLWSKPIAVLVFAGQEKKEPYGSCGIDRGH